MRLVSCSLPTAYRRSTRSRHPRRLFCTTVPRYHHVASALRMKVGGSGHVVLNILKPQTVSSAESNDIRVILPSGPALQASQPQADVLSTASWISRLSEALPLTTIIIVNYRLSSQKHQYPVPIHDAAVAFTYIADPSSPHNAGRAPSISLFGSHIGGSLALMLALTLSSLIQSLTVVEPFVDWVGLDERKSKAKDLPTQDAAANLLSLRSRLFPSPSAYFDPFASPLLFLRAPGRDTPATHSSPLPENEDDPYPQTNSDADAFGPYDDDMTSAVSNTPPKRRKVLRRWPPLGRPEEAMLPYTRIMLREGGGLNGILRDQGKEMADCMRKACFFGREKSVAEDRVQTEILLDAEGVIEEVVLRAVGKPREETAGILMKQ